MSYQNAVWFQNRPQFYSAQQDTSTFYHLNHSPPTEVDIEQQIQLELNLNHGSNRLHQPRQIIINSNRIGISQDSIHSLDLSNLGITSITPELFQFRVRKSQKQLSHNQWFFNHNRKYCMKKSQEDQEKYDMCSICCSEYEVNQNIVILFCNHYFHQQCIKKWLNLKTQCPLCKKDFREHNQYSQFDENYKKRILGGKSFRRVTNILNTHYPQFNIGSEQDIS